MPSRLVKAQLLPYGNVLAAVVYRKNSALLHSGNQASSSTATDASSTSYTSCSLDYTMHQSMAKLHHKRIFQCTRYVYSAQGACKQSVMQQ
jgi:hypothetical protein